MFCVAMDVLPAAVPCERIFSSSKETCTLCHSRVSASLLEALQILKFVYKQDRLNFTSNLLAQEEDYSISGPVTSWAIDELMATGRIGELEELLHNSREVE